MSSKASFFGRTFFQLSEGNLWQFAQSILCAVDVCLKSFHFDAAAWTIAGLAGARRRCPRFPLVISVRPAQTTKTPITASLVSELFRFVVIGVGRPVRN